MSQSIMLLALALLVLVDATNIIFNVFLAHALMKLKKMTNFSYRMIFYMSISDICIGLLGMTRHSSMLSDVLSRNQKMQELAEKTRIFLSFFVGISSRSILIIAVDRFIRMKYLTKYNHIMTKQRRVILIATNLLIGIGEIVSRFPAPIQPFSDIYFAAVQAFHAAAVTSICFLYLWTYWSIKRRVKGLNLQSGPSKLSSCQENNGPSSKPKEAWTDMGVSEERLRYALKSTILPESTTKLNRSKMPCEEVFEVRNDGHGMNNNETTELEGGPIGLANSPHQDADNDCHNEPCNGIDDEPTCWEKQDSGRPCDMPKHTPLNVKCVPSNPKLNLETDHDGRTGRKTGKEIKIEVKPRNGVSQKLWRPDQERNNGTTGPENVPMELANTPCDSGIYSSTIHNERPQVLKNDGPSRQKYGRVRPRDDLKFGRCEEIDKHYNPKASCEASSNNFTGPKIEQKIEIKVTPNNGVSYKRRRPDQEYARSVTFILLAVVICYTPSISLYSYSMITKDTDIPEYISVYTHGATLLNSSLNAIIFLMCNRDFKRFTKNFLICLWRKFLCS